MVFELSDEEAKEALFIIDLKYRAIVSVLEKGGKIKGKEILESRRDFLGVLVAKLEEKYGKSTSPRDRFIN